jgi:hypothetical protein
MTYIFLALAVICLAGTGASLLVRRDGYRAAWGALMTIVWTLMALWWSGKLG